MIHVPGHSPGGLCFYSDKDKLLVAGDVLFQGSIGRADLPGGDMNQLLNGIREKLFVLPDDVRVIPGHGGFSTIGEEKKNESIFSIELYEKDRNNCGHDVRIWTGEIIIGTDKRRNLFADFFSRKDIPGTWRLSWLKAALERYVLPSVRWK